VAITQRAPWTSPRQNSRVLAAFGHPIAFDTDSLLVSKPCCHPLPINSSVCETQMLPRDATAFVSPVAPIRQWVSRVWISIEALTEVAQTSPADFTEPSISWYSSAEMCKRCSAWVEGIHSTFGEVGAERRSRFFTSI
jgi:hypothetical protein